MAVPSFQSALPTNQQVGASGFTPDQPAFDPQQFLQFGPGQAGGAQQGIQAPGGGLDFAPGSLDIGGGAQQEGGFNWLDFALGEKGGDGKRGASTLGTIGSVGLGVAQSYLGLRGLRNAEDALDFQKGMAQENLAIQKSTTNRQLEDRQRGRVASNPNTAVSVADYMQKYGV